MKRTLLFKDLRFIKFFANRTKFDFSSNSCVHTASTNIIQKSIDFLFFALLASCFFFVGDVNAQTTDVFTGNTTFTVPPGVTSIEVQCWGAGGGGGRSASSNTGRGGGGGGAYASSVLLVSSIGTGPHTITIGAGGTGGNLSAVANTGGTTSFGAYVIAVGGGGVANNNSTAGAGGLLSSCTGTIRYSGGNGANGSGGSSGAGGGAAGTGGAGGSAGGMTAGSGTAANGGNGGAGRNNAGSGNGGANYGGGGGGGRSNILGSAQNGGAGASGYMTITYTLPPCTGTPNAGTAAISAASGCGGVNFTLSASGLTNASGITFQWKSSPAGANSWTDIGGATATSLVTNTAVTLDYRLVTTCANSGFNNHTNTVTYTSTDPANLTCLLATNLPCGISNLPGTTICTPGYADGTGYTISNYGVWYTFVGNGVSNTISSTAAAGFDHKMVILSGTCGAYTQIAQRDNAAAGGIETYTFVPTDGTTYFVYIGRYNESTLTGDFTITRSSNPPSAPSAITGSSSVCANLAGNNYSVTNVGGMTYNWTLPAGWSGSSTSNSISATSGSAGGNISVTATNTCGTSAASAITVGITPGPTSVSAGSNFALCSGGSGNLNATGTSVFYTGTTSSQQNVMGSATTDVANAEISVTLAGAPAGAVITGLTFTPRSRVEYCTLYFGGCWATAFGDCQGYNSWVRMQYWNGSAWVDIASCNTPMSISSFNGATVNGTVLRIRTINIDGTIDNVYTDLLAVTATYSVTSPITYAWTSTPAGFTSSVANPSISPSVNTTYNLTATSNGCSVNSSVAVTLNTATPANVLAETGIAPLTGDVLWNGNVSTAWTSASNWYEFNGTDFVSAGSAPATSSRVFILPSGLTNICVSATNSANVAAAGDANSVYIGSGATMSIDAGQTLNVTGNWINNGVFSPSATSSVHLTGTNPIDIGGSGANNFTNLTLNKAAGNVTLSAPLSVTGTFTMTDGKIFTTGGLLTIGASSAIPGSIAWTNGTVIGPLRRFYATSSDASQAAGIFPIGNASHNRYAQVNFTSGNNVGSITAEYISGLPFPALTSGLPLSVNGQMIQNSEAEGFWSIEPATPDNVATYDLVLRGNTLSPTPTNLGQMRIIKSKNHTSWDNVGIGGAGGTAGTFADFTITNVGMNDFSWFNIGSNNAVPLPVQLTKLSAECNGQNEVEIHWQTASEQNSQKFLVERSRDLNSWEYVGEHAALGNSNYKMEYLQIDSSPFGATSYYRLLQTDFDGKETIYGPISVSCAEQNNGMIVFPNPSMGSFTVEISSAENLGDVEIDLIDLTGKLILSQSVNIKQGKNQLPYIVEELEKGTYLIAISSKSKDFHPVRIVIMD